MNAKKLGVIEKGQDGAIFNRYLFRFKASGACVVYQTEDLSSDCVPVSRFVLDKSDIIAPHSNSVTFSNTRYCETDEFPLLYSNVYNNYAKTDNPMKGVTCVYRLERNGNTFSTTLLQLIDIGFTEDPVWSSANGNDVRPYGNFALTENRYYAFTMRDQSQTTRYFAFDLPSPDAGTYDSALGVKRVVLQKEDILEQFDCPYQYYLQGAIYHNGSVYTLEGFTDDKENPPALRLIDVANKKQVQHYLFGEIGLTVEPEFIDFENEICYYADHDGNVFELNF